MTAPGSLRRALAYAAGLAIYGNLLNLIVLRVPARGRNAVGIAGPLLLMTSLLTVHCRLERVALPDLGLHCRRWRGELVWGTLTATLLALPALLFFRPPVGRGLTVQFEEVRGIGLPALLRRLLITTPFLVAFSEELAFRGFLQGRLQRALPNRPAIAVALSSLSFALWHVAVNIRTLYATNVLTSGLATLPIALAVGLVSVFAGGLVFGLLYLRGGSLLGPIACHWLVDALMLLALYFQPAAGRAGDAGGATTPAS
jgi:membrane protease YdiL (CAAX protease family)